MSTHHQAGHGSGAHPAEAGSTATVPDPVCGMQVDPAEAKHRAEHEGTTYYFCSDRCRKDGGKAKGATAAR